MKAYKVELLVIDFEDIGKEDIQIQLEYCKHINPQVMNIQEADIGEWTDDHPLNKFDTQLSYYKQIFG